MIVVVDYGMSNLGSMMRSLEECGAEVCVSDDPSMLAKSSKIVLPGVGSFFEGMQCLKSGGWIEPLKTEVISNEIPTLGICLGMQMLADIGYEGKEKTEGLGFISGEVHKLVPQPGECLPHVGWNEVHQQAEHNIFKGIEDKKDFYFVHSYHFQAQDSDDVIATTPYCNKISTVVAKSNIVGVQFHPEKSQLSGFQLLKNFLEI